MSDALTNCPKCGFNQPVDQYCANCGIDMLAAKRRSASSISGLLKKPGVIAGLAVLVVALTFGASKIARRASPVEPNQISSLASEAVNSETAEKTTLEAESDNSFRPEFETSNQVPPAVAFESATSAAADSSIQTAARIQTQSLSNEVYENEATANKGAASKVDAELMIAFAWTEVSREWLQSMAAAEPGLHTLPDLEERLRAAPGAYRILEVSRHTFGGEATSVSLPGSAGRSGLKIELSGLSPNNFAGSVQLLNERRAPAADLLSIEKGQGSIFTFQPAVPAPGLPPTANEIVVLILPRWGSDRNP